MLLGRLYGELIERLGEIPIHCADAKRLSGWQPFVESENNGRWEPMRQGQQNRRGRGRGSSNNPNNNRKTQNPLARSYESSGPDVKIRGTAAQIAEKYTALARDASAAGDVIMAENYLQHAEHYNRIIMAAQAQNTQPIAHNGSEAGHALNGAHRGHREGNGALRDQPQPHFNGEDMDAQPRLQPASAELPLREQPTPREQPVVEGDMFSETKPVAAKAEPAGAENETGRRGRRRRYPNSNAANREPATEGGDANTAGEKPVKAKSAGEEQPSDEATA